MDVMNTISNKLISKYIYLFLLFVSGISCNDKNENEDTNAPILISQNINEDDVTGPNGYIELTFSKAMRQAPDTEIYFNGKIIRISINYEKVRYSFSGLDNKKCSLEIPAGALTDMHGIAYNQDFTLNFTAKSEISGGEKLFDAVVDSKGNGDFSSIQAAINAAPGERKTPYKIFITNGSYNECIRVTKNKTFIHLIGESRNGVKIQYALNRAGNYNDETQGNATDDAWKYSINNPNSPARKAGYTKDQNCVFLVEATDFYAANVSIINLYGALPNRYTGGLGKDGQAEALITRDDRFSLYNCILVSFQDTWWCRHNAWSENLAYLYNTQIEGRTDYIWGSGNLFIEKSSFYNTGDGAYITASGETGTWGYVMKDCSINGESGITPFSFGRPYKTKTKTVWINTKVEMDIIPSHWSSWSSIPTLYGEYNTTDKSGKLISTESKTVGTGDYGFISSVLTPQEAESYTYEKIVKTKDWDPKQYMENPLPEATNISLNEKELSWDAMSGAKGYLVFINGNYIGQTTENKVTLTNTNASNIYIVKTVSEYGIVSK